MLLASATTGSGMSTTCLSRPPLFTDGPHPHRRLVSHAVQPVAYGLSRLDRSGLADENEERRLERILGVVVAAEQTAQTPHTIGACRRTRAVRAASSRLFRKMVSNSPSVISASSRTKAVRRCWMTTLIGLVAIVSNSVAVVFYLLFLDVRQFDTLR